ncbi:type I DNA topoisomerase [Calderihabitans maritimus]|uniref:DNA topoisomerase 1 n=1 Tax=Calderihabitans maritimus TaxID=1246530 RepID=A0A1Z5HYC1_9FIRM|nr:type I DNA topoisomerase [Calderihabitans maritimus]GAW94331.1 DNA topoisomerase I [Calderihabitans maritimus]
MSKTLVIVESPAKAKTISRFLGKKFVVKSSMGHVRDLPKSQFGVDVEKGFEPKYITIRGKGEILKELKAAAHKSKRILLAPDPDREGEAIAWHLQKILQIDENEPCRIEFNEITKKAIQKAIEHPRTIDYNRVNAQQARRILDRLVGYNLSPLLWRKIKKGLSAGRVQSVAVRLICDREREIEEFVPEEYWSLTAILEDPSKPVTFKAKLIQRNGEKIDIRNEEQMKRVLRELEGAEYVVVDLKERTKKRNPSAPFITSTLQQEAYRKLNFTARKTMQIAQQLYEGISLGKKEGPVGLITYIRTDSTRISSEAVDEVRKFIREKFGKHYLPDNPRIYVGKKGAQDAHEAIRPTSVFREPEGIKKYLTQDQFKLYKLIWDRFVACQMSSAQIQISTVDIRAGNFLFRATGSSIVFPGFMKIYVESGEEETDRGDEKLPELKVGAQLRLIKLEDKRHFTQPPPRYTEASLVKALEEKGIGRPSTYAPILETILARGYVVREQRHFYPTELGMVVVDLLKQYFPDIIDVEFTANMEDRLDKIEEGQLPWRQVVGEFYRPFQELLQKADREIEQIEIEEEVSEEVCEKCGRNLVVKFGRYGKFLACPGFPECRYTKPLLETIGVDCPQCEGTIVLRRNKKGRKFYGCSNYPECNYVSWWKPTNKECPECGTRLVEKYQRNGVLWVCPEEECFYQQQAEKNNSDQES